VESCGLPDRVNKLFGTKIMALLTLFNVVLHCFTIVLSKKNKPSTFFPLFLATKKNFQKVPNIGDFCRIMESLKTLSYLDFVLCSMNWPLF
jgi:hypothetical protein